VVFGTNMSEKRRFTSPSAMEVKNRRKTAGIEEKLDVINRLEKGERIFFYICWNVRRARVSVRTLFNKTQAAWYFLRPAQAVTWRTVAIIIRVVYFLHICAFVAFLRLAFIKSITLRI
jgi:hypothetical protein